MVVVSKNPVRNPQGTREWSRSLTRSIGFGQDGAGWNTLYVEVIAGETPPMWYLIEAGGRIVPGKDTEAREGRTVRDGVWEAQGTVGPTGFDTWFIQADSIQSFDAFELEGADTGPPTANGVDESQYRIFWNGEEVSLDDIVDDSGNGNGNGDGNGDGNGNGNGNGNGDGENGGGVIPDGPGGISGLGIFGILLALGGLFIF